jgi:hypothetical protein
MKRNVRRLGRRGTNRIYMQRHWGHSHRTLLSACLIAASAITIRLHSRRLRNKMPDLTRNGAILLLGSTFHKLAQVRR